MIPGITSPDKFQCLNVEILELLVVFWSTCALGLVANHVTVLLAWGEKGILVIVTVSWAPGAKLPTQLYITDAPPLISYVKSNDVNSWFP